MGAHQDQFRGFAEYNREFNRRLYGVAAELSDAERKRGGCNITSVNSQES